MIKPEELRLDNYVNDSLYGTEIQVTLEHFKEETFDMLEPIPLSEEWLLKFGFTRQPWGLVKGGLLFKDKIKHPCEELTLEVGNGFRVTVRCVHELQNLFSVFGEELTLNKVK